MPRRYVEACAVNIFPIVLAMMWYFHDWNAAAFLYLDLHGTYTLLWLVKQSVFADKRFARLIPLRIAVFTLFLPLMAYMIGPYLLISEHTVTPNWVFAVAPFLCLVGVFLHYVSDAQRNAIRERLPTKREQSASAMNRLSVRLTSDYSAA